MALNIKKPNYINTSEMLVGDELKKISELSKDHPFILFKDLMEKSWNVKINDIKKGEELQEKFDQINDLKITVDSLKNKSLITYIDAPWGSGKTYFIEKLIEWTKNEKDEKKFNFSNGKKSSLDINFIDAWEINNNKSIEDFLIEAYSIEVKDFEDFLKNVEEFNEKIKKWTKRFGRIMFSPIERILNSATLKLAPGGVGIDFDLSELLKDENLKKSFEEPFKKEIDSLKLLTDQNKLKILLVTYIEDKYIKNNKLIIIDNIERLDSNSRLKCINAILNWANFSGTTFLFLTNFEKIKITKDYEEDFWNKISLHETFKLTNSWQTYVSNYKKETSFDLNDQNYLDLKDFILNIIPSFFSNNEDDMDIREIKKLLDNWNIKNESTNKELIISLLREIIEKNSGGLDKYFLINHSVTWLSENKWNLWEDDKVIDDETKNDAYNNIPLINNKMFRIQSNFYDLEVEVKNNKAKFKNSKNLKISEKDISHFKKFNNFIDDNATQKFRTVIESVLSTRNITNKDNYIFKYMDYIKLNNGNSKANSMKYFEFKYNNIKKLHIYNDIFK